MDQEQIRSLKTASTEEKRRLIENFGIYELRGFARALGVSSPTTKKREELIESIIASLENDMPLEPKQSSKGRPYKKLNSIESFLSIVSEKDQVPIELPKIYTYEDIAIFAQETPIFDYQSDELIFMKGVVRVVKKTAYFIDTQTGDVVFISTQMFNEKGLRTGDLIECMAYRINESKQYYLKELISINERDAESYFPTNIEPKKILPSLTREFSGKSIVLGGRNLITLNEPFFMSKNVKQVLSEFDSSENTIVFLGVNMCYEDIEILKEYKNIVKFTSQYSGDYSKDFDKVIDSISLAQRLPEEGKNVIFVVYDVVNILNSLDMYFYSTDTVRVYGHMQPSTVIIKKLISLASAFETGKDCTDIFVSNQVDMEDEFVKNEILKVSNKF